MDITQLKTKIGADIDARREELAGLSLKIHSNPELGFHEVKAAEWLAHFLENNGFTVERGVCGLPTAFFAHYGKGKPVIAILAEYDALPDMGHACGHNIIAASAVGAGIAARFAVDQCGGTVRVIGTPAEEMQGGKILMGERGAFRDVDAALIIHPGILDATLAWALACISLHVEFFGRSAHAAAQPEAGINALEAMLVSFSSINSLRQHIKPSSRLHGIITDGGKAPNIVPAHSAADFLIRDESDAYLDQLQEKVLNCFKGAAIATGARLEYRWGDTRYASMRNNRIISHLFYDNMKSLGRQILFDEPYRALGSTDMGNVSQLVPCIHPFVSIGFEAAHTTEFARAAASETGTKAVIDAAKSLAMTAADLLSDPKNMAQAREEFMQHG